jgi:outer membrane cobalamin receptor
MDKQLKPWQLPALELGVKGTYNLGDKIILGLDVFYVGTRYARVSQFDKFSGTGVDFKIAERKLNGFIDASINAEYRYTKKLAAFIRLNNLAAQQYQIWNNYPSQRINGLLGVNFSF